MSNEMLDFGNDIYGIALNLEEDSIGAVILGDYLEISEGDEVRPTGKILEVPVGEAVIGRVVNPLGLVPALLHRGHTVVAGRRHPVRPGRQGR